MAINPLNDSGDSSSSSSSSSLESLSSSSRTTISTISTSLSSTTTIDSITNSSNLSSSTTSRSAGTSLHSSNRILSASMNNNNNNNNSLTSSSNTISTPIPIITTSSSTTATITPMATPTTTTTPTPIAIPKNLLSTEQPQLSTPSSSSQSSKRNSSSSSNSSGNSSKRNSKNGNNNNILTEEDYIDFNINLTNKFKNELGCFGENEGGSSTTSGNNTPKSNRSSLGNNNCSNGSDSGLSRNNSNNQLKSNHHHHHQNITIDDTPLTNLNSVMLRVKFPESHQIITKILRLPLSATIKECLYRIHQMVGLDNYKQCSISYNQSTLSPSTPLSAIFNGGDDSVVPTIEIKVNGGSNKSSPRPILSHSSSVQSLLQGVSIKKKAITSGQSPKDSILFQPPHPSYTKDLEGLFWTTSPNHPHKSIPCLYHKWKSRDDKYDSKLTILYSGGNLEDIGLTRRNMKILSNILQVNILCFDFTGFGLNTSNGGSKPSLKECLEDLFIIFNYLTNTLRINSKNIILMGKSIGTIATLKFASELFPKINKNNSNSNTPNGNGNNNSNNVKQSILTSPIESCKQYKSVGGLILLNSFGPGGLSDNIVNLLLSLDAFDHLKKVERITCPVLLIHSEEDQIVNVKSSKKLSKLFTNLYKFTRVKDAGHWNLDTHYLDDYEDDLIEFVKLVSPESFANRKERDEPPSYSMSPNKVVGGWLDRLELSQYTQNFLQFGYFDMASISTLDDISLLEMIGITDQNHISIFTREIEKITKSLYGSMVSTISNFSTTSSNTNLSSASSGINSSSTPSSTTPSCSTRNSANLDDFGSNSSSST